MRKKLAGYTLLSLSSFFFFFAVFHTSANAEGSPIAPLIARISETPSPSPILPSPTKTVTPSPTEIPTPTQTPTETPTPTPTETPSPSPTEKTEIQPQPTSNELEAWFTKYAEDFHIDREQLRRTAQCESGFNTNANNNDLYLGMYQFGESAWIGARQRMGLDSNVALRTNAEEAIKTAAFKINQGEQGAWPNCQ